MSVPSRKSGNPSSSRRLQPRPNMRAVPWSDKRTSAVRPGDHRLTRHTPTPYIADTVERSEREKRMARMDPEYAACGCGVDEGGGDGRKAAGVDADAKDRNIKRLRRIEGQVRGIQRMVDEDRYCADILTQISSVQEALRSVGRELMKNHLKHCAAQAIAAGGTEADEMYDELVGLMYRSVR